MRSTMALAALLALLAPAAARADEPPDRWGDVYIRWRAGLFRPAVQNTPAFSYSSSPGFTVGAATGLPIGEHLALEAGLGYLWARLNQSVDSTSPAATNLDDLSVVGRVVGRLELGHAELLAGLGLAVHHPTVAALARSSPDLALAGQVTAAITWVVWHQASLGLEVEDQVLRPRYQGKTLRLDGLLVCAALRHPW